MLHQTTALEQSFMDACATHDVEVFDITINMRQSASARFCCTMHWAGIGRCVIEHGPTIEAAIAKAVKEMTLERTETPSFQTFGDDALPLGTVEVLDEVAL